MTDTMDRPAKVPKKKKALSFLKFASKQPSSFDDTPFEEHDEGNQKRGEDDEDSLTLFKRSKDFFPVVIKEQEEKPRDVTPEQNANEKHATGDDDEESTPSSTRSSKRRRLSSPQPVIEYSAAERYSELYGPATPPQPVSKSPTLLSRVSPAKRYTPTSSKRVKQATPASRESKGKDRVDAIQSDILPTPSRSNSHQSSARDVVALDDEDPFENNTPNPTTALASQTKNRPTPAVKDGSPPGVIDIADSDDDLVENDSEPQEDELAYFITRAAEKEAAAKAATAALIPSDDDSADEANPSTPDGAHTRRRKSEPMIAIKIFVVSRLPGDVVTNKVFGSKRGHNQSLGLVRSGFIQWARKIGMDISLEMERDIFLTWKGRRIYDSATGVSLGWQPTAAGEFPQQTSGFSGGGVMLEAWTMAAFEEYKEAQERQRLIDRGEMADEEVAAEDSEGAGGDVEEQQEPEVPKIKLFLTAKDTAPLRLSVYADTTIKILIGAYRKQRDVPNDRDIRLQFDGEWLNPNMTVEEADIDEMCTVEVYIR